jgi:outer membrane lipoprotein-sorting protein
MKTITSLALLLLLNTVAAQDQSPEQLIQKTRQKLERVSDYVASGKMKMNISFLKAPVADVKIYYKKPDKLKIHNESGISLIPKGSVNISMGSIVAKADQCDLIDGGREAQTGLRIVKLLPKEDEADIVLSVLYIDEQRGLIKKAKTTTKENGTYELAMEYGKYADYGLADKVTFTFNTKDYKMPKGVTFDYDDGSNRQRDENEMKEKKGTVEISYAEYKINKGIPDSAFK